MLCELTPARMLTELRVVSTVRTLGASTVSTLARFVTEDGRPGVEVE